MEMSFKKGEIIPDVEVVDIGDKGKSIAKKGEFVIITEKVVPGDVVDIFLYKKKKNYGEGNVRAIKQFSPIRIEPVCQHFYDCGGCKWQNIKYTEQLKFKQKQVFDTIERIGGVSAEIKHPILGSQKTEFYRNRLDYAFSHQRWVYNHEDLRREDAPPGLGFHIAGKFDKVFDVLKCHLQEEPSNAIRNGLREYTIAKGYEYFDLRRQTGFLRSLIIKSTGIGEVMVILAFFKNDEEAIADVLGYLQQNFPAISSLYYVINPKANDSVYDLEHILHSGKSYITEKLNGITYRVGPKSFFQTNPWQAETLFKRTKEMAGLTGNELVYDLYTGVGSIALYIADSAKKVIGIETIDEAIDYAKTNALDNGITNCDFFAGDVKKIVNDEFVLQNGRPDVIITDPPRAGMDASVVAKILELAPQKIVYVSCNPSTQARDLQLLSALYDVKEIQPVDMFPHTHHVENIALLIKR
ncbi:MAG: 23S rRNA (uracil(1939)-C(5))-methyltransferase RlmD [Bacteroidetes bacterium]|nr:23S rRNA (uracil(1939)-C(5))-methyltransferase RlmD [Bacteroidota bacterium]